MRTRFAYLLLLLFFFATAAGAVESADIDAVLDALMALPASGAPSASLPENRRGLYPEIRVRVTSPRHTVVSSQISGRVDAVHVRNGDTFTPDDILLEIDPTFEAIQLQKAETNLRRSELLLQMTEELVRLETKGELELELARVEVRMAEAEVAFCRARLDRMRVRVPFAGRVGVVLVRELETVADGQPLVEVIDETVMELECIVSSAWIRWFRPGYEFTVTVDETGKTYHARLDRIGGKVDPLSKSINAYATLLDADQDLMEGMSGEARIVVPEGAPE